MTSVRSNHSLSLSGITRCLRTSALVAAAIVLCVGMSPAVKAQDSTATTIPTVQDPRTPEIQKQIQADYDEMADGFARFDVGAATKYYAADYRSVDRENHKGNLARMKTLYRSLLSHALVSKMKTEITLCVVVGDTATVQTHMLLYISLRDDAGENVVIDGEDHGRSFWVKRKGFWQMKQEHDFDFTLNRNGQRFAE